MTDDELKAIRQRWEGLPPAPWAEHKVDDWACAGVWVVQAEATEEIVLSLEPIEVERDQFWNPTQAVIEALTHAPTDIASLLAEVERLQERCEQLYYEGLEE